MCVEWKHSARERLDVRNSRSGLQAMCYGRATSGRKGQVLLLVFLKLLAISEHSCVELQAYNHILISKWLVSYHNCF